VAREVRLWQWMHEGLKFTPCLHMRRVENLVSEGDPDVDGCWEGRYFEIELKGCDRPKRGGPLDFDLRQSQALWHRKRWHCGGNLWLYVRVGSHRQMARYLLPGALTYELHLKQKFKDGITEEDLLALCVLPITHTQKELLERVIKRWEDPGPRDA
jgi:hypothetical protein